MQKLETYKDIVKIKKEDLLKEAERLGFEITIDEYGRHIINYIPTEHLNLIMKIEKRRILSLIQINIGRWAKAIEKARIGADKELFKKYPYIEGHEKQIIELLREIFDLDRDFDVDY